MRLEHFSFGSIRIDGTTYEHDVVIDRGEICKRKKKVSKKFRDEFGHTPLSAGENIPWKCQRLVVGTGANGALPVMEEVKLEAERRRIIDVLRQTGGNISKAAQVLRISRPSLHELLTKQGINAREYRVRQLRASSLNSVDR